MKWFPHSEHRTIARHHTFPWKLWLLFGRDANTRRKSHIRLSPYADILHVYNCQILGVMSGPKTQVSDHRYHRVHQLAIDAVMVSDDIMMIVMQLDD
jgi:hypothetical protein